jgi:hypothetical protein
MKSKGLTPERLERIKQIITEQKNKDINNDDNAKSADELGEQKMEKKIKFIVTAKLINTYKIEVMATDAGAAIDSLDEWVAEDFEDFLVGQQWDLETC